jgi:hypothetical protein
MSVRLHAQRSEPNSAQAKGLDRMTCAWSTPRAMAREPRPTLAFRTNARPRITARRTNDKGEGTDIPDASTSGKADGIDEPADGMNDKDARIEIPDDGMNVIDAVTNEDDDRLDVIEAMTDAPAEPTDQPAKEGEVSDEPIDRMEERMNRNVNRIEVQCSNEQRAALVALLLHLKAYFQVQADANAENAASIIERAGIAVWKPQVRKPLTPRREAPPLTAGRRRSHGAWARMPTPEPNDFGRLHDAQALALRD